MYQRRFFTTVAPALAAAIGTSFSAAAAPVTYTFDDLLIPQICFSDSECLNNVDVSAVNSPPHQLGSNQTMGLTLSLTGTLAGTTAGAVNATGSVTVTFDSRTGDATGYFDTELPPMTLTGTVGGSDPVSLETGPSLGTAEVTNPSNGLFRIDSFFDIFTELSLDNGATFTPQSDQNASQFESTSFVPEVPEPASVLLIAAAGLGLVAASRRRRR